MKYTLSLIVALLLLGCGQPANEFRLGLFWGAEETNEELAYSIDIITADDLAEINVKNRIALTRDNDRLGIKPIKEVMESASYEYYEIPSKHRTEHNGKINFGYVWIKPKERDSGNWTNTQLWVKASVLAEGKTICHNIGSNNPWAFYLSGGACDIQAFDICDDSITKLGLMYSKHYDIGLLSSTAHVLNICEQPKD